MVTFSVVIPAYNEEKYIGRTLSALRNQTFKDFEIIVKDGKSQDQTIKIARKFTKKVFSQKDTSAADARNQGASHATGQILVFIDADTALPPDTLAHFSELMKNEGIVGISCRKVPQSNKTLDRLMYEFVNISTYVSAMLRIGGAHGNLMILRRYAFEQVGGFNPNIIVAEEQDLVRRATKYGRYKFLLDYSVLENPRRLQTWGRLRIYIAWLIGMYKSFRVGKRQPYEKIR